MRHRIFVGSSKEELKLATAIQRNLVQYGHTVKVWNQGVFSIGKAPLEALIAALDKFDAAVFVFAPNDLVRVRDRQLQAVRDNVVFELGLFTGRLGRDRTFWLVPSDETDVRTVSDLLGIIPAEYTPPTDDDWVGALAVACDEIHQSLSESAVTRGRYTPALASSVFMECAPLLNRVMERLASAVHHPVTAEESVEPITGGFRIQLPTKSHLTVIYGRIDECPPDDGRSAIVLPANEFFDDACLTDLRSALGSFVKRRFEGRVDDFTKLVARLRAELPSTFVERESGKYQESYGVGTSLYVPAPLGQDLHLILTAVTRKRAGEGIKAEPGYILSCLNSICRIMNDEKLTDVYLPVLGSGHGDLSNEVALFCLVSGISTIADIKHAHVVIYQGDPDSAPSIAPATVRRMLMPFADAAIRT
jgi:CAP12/Pycsar effector protein, TIR domain/Thoeris protein ThsA, Macro domain